VTWNDVEPIFVQYANLYPVMNRFLDMGDFDAVVKNAGLLKMAFGLDPSNPNSMPVTRDLSPAKRATILHWLDNPVRGSVTVKAKAKATASPAKSLPVQAAQAAKGGKAAAAARRLILNP
jgi:hypothetical protein